MSTVLSFEEFLAADGIDYDIVKTRGGDVRIGSITPTDLDEWNELRSTPDGKKVSGPLLILKSLVDGDGKRIGVTTPYEKMNDEERGRVAKLQTMNLKTSEQLLLAIFKLNGIGQPAGKEKNV